jgi:hypothetical protein
MNAHSKAKLTAVSRAEMIHRIVDLHQPVAQVAAGFAISERCASKWLGRFRTEGLPCSTIAVRLPDETTASAIAFLHSALASSKSTAFAPPSRRGCDRHRMPNGVLGSGSYFLPAEHGLLSDSPPGLKIKLDSASHFPPRQFVDIVHQNALFFRKASMQVAASF